MKSDKFSRIAPPKMPRRPYRDALLRVALFFLVWLAPAAAAFAQTVTVPAEQTTKALWVAAADYNLRTSKDYGSMVVASSLNAFYKTYPNATSAQAQELVSALQAKLSGAKLSDYVIGHQTQADIVHALFKIAGEAPLPQTARVSLTVAREGYDALQREMDALRDEQAKVARETGLGAGFRLASDPAYFEGQLGELYDQAKHDPAKAALIDGALGKQLGSPTGASAALILQANPSFQQFQSVQYVRNHMLTGGQFQDGVNGLRGQFAAMLSGLKTQVDDDVLPLLRTINQTQLDTYRTLQEYVAATAERERLQQLAQQRQQAHQLQLQAAQSAVYLLSAFGGSFDPKLGRTLNVVGNTAIQVNAALTNYSVAASSVDTSSIGGQFTGEQLGAVVLAGNLISATMQLTVLFQDNSSPDQLILEQIAALRQQISQMQAIMINRFDRIDGQLNQIAGSIDLALRQLSEVGRDLGLIQTQLFTLQSQMSRLEIEIHEWLSNSDRIALVTAINNALGYEQRNGRRLPLSDFINNENILYTYATYVAKDTTRAGPDYSSDMNLESQLKFPITSNVNVLTQMVSRYYGFPPVASAGTRLVSLTDWLCAATAYYRLLKENPNYAAQLPGLKSRLRDVIASGRQVAAALEGMANQDLFLDPSKGLVARYQQKLDALKSAVQAYRDGTFLPANACGPSSFDGCIPPGVSLWDGTGSASYRPSAPPINACDGARQLNTSVPGNDIFYAVPSALLEADRRLGGGQFKLCLAASYETPGAYSPNGAFTRLLMTIRVSFRDQHVLDMNVISGPRQAYLVWSAAYDPYWFFVPGDPVDYSTGSWEAVRTEGLPYCRFGPPFIPCVDFTFKGQFEDHSQVTITYSDWAQRLHQTLADMRARYYTSVALEFTKDGGIGRGGRELGVAKTLLTDFLELSMPRTLEGDDYLRSLLYGSQRLLVGLDPVDGDDVQNLYASAGSLVPELDIKPISERRVEALSGVLTQVFARIAASQFAESNPRLDYTISRLSDLAFEFESGLTPSQAPTSVSAVSASGVYKGTAILTATLTSGGAPLSGKAIAFTLNGGAVATATTDAVGTATLSGVSLSGVNAGTYPDAVGASFAGDAGFMGSSAVGAASVARADQTSTFDALADRAFGDPDFQLRATASSGLVVSFAAAGDCTAPGSTLHITGAGSCTVTASQGGDSNYNAAADVRRSFRIVKAATWTAISSSANPSAPGQVVTFAAAVNSAASTPTGSVRFKADGASLGPAAQIDAGGVASLKTSALPAGAHSITAEYDGDVNFNGSAAELAGEQVSGSLFEFGRHTYTVAERGGRIDITVRREGNVSAAASVGYATDDGSVPSVAVLCSSVTGLALERCDYTRAEGTLSFAAGETEKSFTVLVNDDSYTEGAETSHLRLSGPSAGAALARQSSATLEITDDTQESSGNVINDDEAFVRQHYHDFLNREPDAEGLKFWTDGIKACGVDAGCREARRVHTSAAFFLSIEFQQTGYLVYRLDVATLDSPNRLPREREFFRDTQSLGSGVVVGQAGWQEQLEANKRAFIEAFVNRPEFLQLYPAGIPPAGYVDALYSHAGITPTDAERQAAVLEFGNPAGARGRVLRRLAESDALGRREFNRAFVLAEYFGYLRRGPDSGPDLTLDGLNFWLAKLDAFGGDYIRAEMVKAFISSDEYRGRFGR